MSCCLFWAWKVSSAVREVMCPRPPNIANGLHSGQSSDKFSRGSTVSYSCRDGYELVGNVSISCAQSGLWSQPLPRCEGGCLRRCWPWGRQKGCCVSWMLHFDCDAGYFAEDTYESWCQPGGTWDPPVLVCKRVRPCPMPPGVRNGYHDGQGKAFFTMGMFVTYTCDPGYYLVGKATVFCGASGNWSQPVPRCEGESVAHPLGQEGPSGALSTGETLAVVTEPFTKMSGPTGPERENSVTEDSLHTQGHCHL
uniref:Sushi domain-containing protein n=1 Tax=Calidris pygmaea TaxID=425635 RepID=A0A8C3KRG5_9CHAR